MPTFAPDELAAWTGGRWTSRPAAPLTGFTTDTRQLRAGQVFVALSTDRRDGHAFLPAAAAAGAGAALVAAAQSGLGLPQLVVADPLAAFQAIARAHRRTFRGPVVGITGSAGKTSTKNLLALLLGGPAGGVLATEGNLNNHLGVPLTLTRLDPARHTFAVIEAGISAPGEMAPLAAMIAPDVVVITLVAAAHTEQLGGLEGVAREKAALAAALPPSGAAIFPESCAAFAAFQAPLPHPRVLARTADLRAAPAPGGPIPFQVLQRTEQTEIVLAAGGPKPARFTLSRVTDGMASNAALALTAALHLGVAPDRLQARLAGWAPAPLRGEIRRTDGRLLYLDCYNANPASMADALATFQAIAPAPVPRLYVLGGMEELGAASADCHRALGRSLALRAGDRVLVLGAHANEVCAGVLEQGDYSRQIQLVSALETVAAVLAEWRGAVFVKGSRRYQLERALAGAVPMEAAHA